MSDSADWRSVIEVIIPHPSAPRVLLLAEGEGWSLPHLSIDDLWAVDVDQICHELRRMLGIATTILRLASKRSDDHQRQVVMTYVLENRAPSWQPPPYGRWANRAEFGTLVQPEQQAVLDAYLTEAESGLIPELRVPWCRSGWLDAATAWIDAQLEAHGTPLVDEVEQVTNWALSCVLRGHTAAGAVYFKAAATLPLFVNEPVVMAALARRYSDHLPAPLSLDPQRRWMLLPDLGQPLGYDAPLAARQELLCSLGALQRACVAAEDELLELGCLDRRLERLSAQVATLAADAVALSGLTDAERAQFREALPRLQAMCAALAACGIPHTLVHGDLHLHNVAVNAGRHQFFDWTDACVSHPFFDLISVFDDENRDRQEQLRNTYLSLWSDCAPLEQLLEVWALAQQLSDLHQAISYQHILVGLEPSAQVEFGDSVPYYVRKVLQALGSSP